MAVTEESIKTKEKTTTKYKTLFIAFNLQYKSIKLQYKSIF